MKNTKKVKSLKPLFTDNTKLLIIGTLPGSTAVTYNEYYSTEDNNGNKFWGMILQILNKNEDENQKLTYKEKITLLDGYGIGFWDIIKSAEVEIKADSEGRSSTDESILYNTVDFNNLDKLPKNIEYIIFNGRCNKKKEPKDLHKKIKIHLEEVEKKSGIKVKYCQSTSSRNISPGGLKYEENWRQALIEFNIIN